MHKAIFINKLACNMIRLNHCSVSNQIVLINAYILELIVFVGW